MTQALKPPKVQAEFEIGQPALYHEEHRGRRHVIIRSEEQEDEELGRFRLVAFADLGWDEYDVPVSGLEPCDDNYQPLAETPADLRSLRGRGVDTVEVQGGRVYAPGPFKPRRALTLQQTEIMERYGRTPAAVLAQPDDVEVDRALLSPGQLRTLEAAERKMADAERRPGRAGHHDRKDARLLLQKLQADLLAEQTQSAVSKGQVESIALAAKRGEHIRIVDGQVINQDRDGLRNLVRTGGINPIHWMAGLKWRSIYEATERSLRSQIGQSTGGGVEDDRKLKDVGAQLVTRKEIEADVMAACKNGRGVTTLRLVAGEGRTITSISRPGKSSDRILNTKALVLALDIVADRFGLH